MSNPAIYQTISQYPYLWVILLTIGIVCLMNIIVLILREKRKNG